MPMDNTFYIPRYLLHDSKVCSEAEIIANLKYVVILAEPGGGKSELMSSFAKQLGVKRVTASQFAYSNQIEHYRPLIVDAFDELARIDSSANHKIFSKAAENNPSHFYMSSRSSEWSDAFTNDFKNYFGQAPTVVRLCDFDETQQRQIFENHLPGENFNHFKTELSRFDLDVLLPKPQFLKLFADAYIEGNRYFIDKRTVFHKSVERLAKEVNQTHASKASLSPEKRIRVASEVFAKLLLSGAEGVSTSELQEDRLYPLLSTLTDETENLRILSSRLFKVGDYVEQHRPVHKIVSEFCAADYLIRRVESPTDPLTLSKCLPIIAPNSTVRDELRGLIGWMATLGIQSTQLNLIELDSYAVLANGDPSQLTDSSKCKLINRLKDIEKNDPYFRRGDFWRRFSVAGFFTNAVVNEIRPLLKADKDGHLRDLILEILADSPATNLLTNDLQQLLLSPRETQNTRALANICLLGVDEFDHSNNLKALVSEGSHNSLSVAGDIVLKLGADAFEHSILTEFFAACSRLYPPHNAPHDRIIGHRYFVKRVTKSLGLMPTENLLDELTQSLSCVCGKKAYECDCREGRSKLIGMLLDQYFELKAPPYDAIKIWSWLENLNFHEHKNSEQSNAVKVLQEDSDLRQQIITHVFGSLTDRGEIFDIRVNKFDWHGHDGLHLKAEDIEFIIELAFDRDNVDLWAAFFAGHRYHQKPENQGPYKLRSRMREQALEKPAFMREWVLSNKRDLQLQQDHSFRQYKYARKAKRRKIEQARIESANKKLFIENRALIESGCHWGCLERFAQLVLHTPEKIAEEVGDAELVSKALRNCLEFISPYVPQIAKCAELNCASQSLIVEIILYAACLEIMRLKGHLNEVDINLLGTLRTGAFMSYSGVSSAERDALALEVDRILFAKTGSAESFIRQYVEPQLAQQGCKHPEVWLLQTQKPFKDLRATLSIEWLNKFQEMPLTALNTLFEIASQYANEAQLKHLIKERCSSYMTLWPEKSDDQDIEDKRTFWLVRAWFFLEDTPEIYWNWLKNDKDTILIFDAFTGRQNYGDHQVWPKLTPIKIEKVLDAFIEQWPKVDLPNHWGTESPRGEKAYRYLTEIIWNFSAAEPDEALPVLQRLLASIRFIELHNDLKSIHAGIVRKKALRDFHPPSPIEIIELLDRDTVVTVEGLRQLVVDELQNYQKDIDGGEFNVVRRFYENGKRLDEVRATEIIAERLSLTLKPKGIVITPEHQLKDANRSDFTVTKVIAGNRRLLVTEVKGQWHKELFSAANAQLHERYAIHKDAEQQGIYLVLWFGKNEKVANRKKHGFNNAHELRIAIQEEMPIELKGLIDVFVLDVSL
jgi:hypothetical protein